MKLVVNGVLTRKVARITEELYGTEFFRYLYKQLDPVVSTWNARPLQDEKDGPVIATYNGKPVGGTGSEGNSNPRRSDGYRLYVWNHGDSKRSLVGPSEFDVLQHGVKRRLIIGAEGRYFRSATYLDLR
jgi:hypothetical protein